MAKQYFYELYFYTLMLNKIEDMVSAVLIAEHGIHHYNVYLQVFQRSCLFGTSQLLNSYILIFTLKVCFKVKSMIK